jgi:hypothetical protein
MALPPDANDIVREDLCHQLRAGHSLFFRNLRLAPRWAYIAAALAALVVLVAACHHYGEILPWLATSLPVNHWIFAAAAAAIVFVGVFRIWFFESFFALVGLIGSNIHLRLRKHVPPNVPAARPHRSCQIASRRLAAAPLRLETNVTPRHSAQCRQSFSRSRRAVSPAQRTVTWFSEIRPISDSAQMTRRAGW